MEENRHPFERLPEPWQQHPIVMSAWLADLSHRSKGDGPPPPEKPKVQILSPLTIRVVVLLLLAATSAGIIKPEMLLKLLPILLKMFVGAPL